jgi:long-chain fatty acid transport protein
MRTLSASSLLVLCLCAFASISFSAGFSNYTQGATATGMGGAFTAKADDPTAIFYNPAGITQIEGTRVLLGMTSISPKTTLEDPWKNTWETEKETFLLPNFYLTHQLNDSWNLGLGVFSPYGLGRDWSGRKDFVYRYLVREVTIQSIYVTPVVAYKLNDNWSIAAGAQWVRSKVEYQAAVDMTDIAAALSEAMGTTITLDDSEMTLKGDNENGNWGYSFGIHGKLDRLSMGLSWRSKVGCGYDGNATFIVPESGYGDVVDSMINDFFPDTKGLTSIDMPSSVALGIGYDITERLYAGFDVVWFEWSSYESLDIDFEYEGLPDISQRKDWKDVMSYRLGLHYDLTEQASIFGGFYYDETPVPDDTLDPILPDADRYSFQIGAGYDFGTIQVQGAYMFLQFRDRETTTNYANINAGYESSAHLFGIQAAWKF